MQPSVDSIEEYINFLQETVRKGAENITPTVLLDDKEYKQKLKQVRYSSYMYSADMHYFVSRTLFMHHLGFYSLFSAYQCIENYLKAYIKFKKQTPKLIHLLDKLLKRCKELASPNEVFIRSEELATIISKYQPFYTSFRYPVSKEKFKSTGILYPDDIYVLDYFVYKFREILPYPENQSDVLKRGIPEMKYCKEYNPNFYQSFIEGNINFKK